MFEAYSVAVRVSLIDGVANGLMGMSRHFAHANMEATALQKRLDSIKRTMIVGGVMTGVGLGILGMFKPALEQAKQFQVQTANFANYGMGDKVTAQAVRYAKAMNIIGTSSVEAMTLMNEAQGIFRESGALNPTQQLVGAKIAAPILAKLSFLESSLSDDGRKNSHAQDLAMLRFIEARGGANDPRTFTSIADWGYKLSKSSGGVVDWAQLQQFVATAGAAGFNIGQDSLAKLEPVMADLKGGRLGSGLRVAFGRLLGTQRGLPKQAIAEYLSLGLWDRSKINLNAQGGIQSLNGPPGDVLKGRSLFATDPVAFYVDKFLPAIAKKYGNGILGDSVDARIKRAVEVTTVFGPGTAGSVFTQIDKLMPAIQRSIAAQNKFSGIDASVGRAGGTLAGKEVALHARFNTLLEQTGEVALPIAIGAINAALPVLQTISNFATNHPHAFSTIVRGLLDLGFVLTAGGVATSVVGAAQAFMLLGKAVGGGKLLALATEAPIVANTFKVLGAAATGLNVVKLVAATGAIAGFIGFIGEVANGLKRTWDDAKKRDPSFGLHSLFLSQDDVRGPAQGPRPNYVAPKPKPVVKVDVHNKLDKHGLASMVGAYFGGVAASVQITGGAHDQTMTPATPGLRGNFQ